MPAFLCVKGVENMAVPSVYLEIDASELNEQIERLRSILKPERFDQVMYSIFKRTGNHVKMILRKDLPVDYYVKAGQINAAVKTPQLSGGGGMGVGCVIPIVDSRGTIGGRYGASGGAHGWASLHRKYRVKGRVVKAGASTLPSQMGSYGGQPPFRNLGSRLGGLTFTRAGKARFPIMKVVGIAIPQMPMNRSQDEVQQDILDYMKERMEHEIQRLMAGGR